MTGMSPSIGRASLLKKTTLSCLMSCPGRQTPLSVVPVFEPLIDVVVAVSSVRNAARKSMIEYVLEPPGTGWIARTGT